MSESPLLVVVSGPGGVGKGTVVKALVEEHNELTLSVSSTTRVRRESESADAYNFITREQFEAGVEAGNFLEYTEFLGNYYGTPLPNKDFDGILILEIEVDGAGQVYKKFKDSADHKVLMIFLKAPSSWEHLLRLVRRGDSPKHIVQRIWKARKEANAAKSLGAVTIVNDDVQETVEKIYKLIQKAA